MGHRKVLRRTWLDSKGGGKGTELNVKGGESRLQLAEQASLRDQTLEGSLLKPERPGGLRTRPGAQEGSEGPDRSVVREGVL